MWLQILGWDDVFLFNENYIVKSPESGLRFRWHTDQREQFKCNFLCSSDSEFEDYVSIWCALDECTELNGSLVVPSGTVVLPIDCRQMREEMKEEMKEADDVNDVYIENNKISERNHKRKRSDLYNFFKEGEEPTGRVGVEDSDSETETAVSGDVLHVAPGSAVLFSSRLWHRSGPNTSVDSRRVFYVQYSPVAITGGLRKKAKDGDGLATPLNFAVKAAAAVCQKDLSESRSEELKVRSETQPIIPI